MLDLIPPERLNSWVPGEVLVTSDRMNWSDVCLRSYRYEPMDVEIPALRDFTIVAFTKGTTQIERHIEGPSKHETVGPGDVAVMTRAAVSHWHWDAPIDVVHLYLTHQMLSKVCADVLDRDIADIHLKDVLRADDIVLNRSIVSINEEASNENLGGRLYVDAVSTQICVHLLRNYANVCYQSRDVSSGLSPAQARQVEAYVEANLDTQLSLEELAAITRTSASYFLRQFKIRFGMPPHTYVVQRRVNHAQHLLAKTALPIKDIAGKSGFSDQSHMTRVFQRLLNTTPSGYRQAVTGKT